MCLGGFSLCLCCRFHPCCEKRRIVVGLCHEEGVAALFGFGYFLYFPKILSTLKVGASFRVRESKKTNGCMRCIMLPIEHRHAHQGWNAGS